MSNEFKVKYQGNSFEDWYKTNYGKDWQEGGTLARADGMSDADWEIGQSLYNSRTARSNIDSNYNRSKTELETAYGTNVAELEADRARQARDASYTHELMKKYLPEQIKARGLSGSGVSESTLLSAYSTHANQLGEINANYAKNKNALDNEYQGGLSDLERTYGDSLAKHDVDTNDAVSKIFDKYRTEHNTNEEKKATRQKENYDALMEKDPSEWDHALIKKMADNGELSEGQLEQIKTAYSQSIVTGREAFDGVDIHGAWAYFTDVMNHPWVSTEKKRAVANTFKAMFPDLAAKKAKDGEYTEWLLDATSPTSAPTSAPVSASEGLITRERIEKETGSDVMSEEDFLNNQKKGYFTQFTSYQEFLDAYYASWRSKYGN